MGNSVLERIFDAPPTLALMVTTYGTPTYVHLHLEAAKRFAPGIRVLVHDDASPDYPKLLSLCQDFGATLVSTPFTFGKNSGDLASYPAGLLWAHQHGIDLLVKMSRRWLPLRPWTEELRNLAVESQCATYSGECRHYRFNFRTECVAMHVPSWLRHLGIIRELIHTKQRGFVEHDLHCIAKTIWAHSSKTSREWLQRTTQDLQLPGSIGYCCWGFVNGDRHQRSEEHLWHDIDDEDRYHEVAKSWGLPYALEDFRVE